VKAFRGKPSSPPPNQPRRGIQARRDLGVGEALSGVEHDPRPLHILKWQLLRPSQLRERKALLTAQFDAITGRARHHHQVHRAEPNSFTEVPTDTCGRVY